jgi:hypothetical protein
LQETSTSLHGEAGEVDFDALEPQIKQLRTPIKEYGLDNVYNMDETGLFFKMLPNFS